MLSLENDVIELTGTRIERLMQAIQLAYTEVSEEELDSFRSIYKEAGIHLLPAAEAFYKKYGGVFRNHRLIFAEAIDTECFEWEFLADSRSVKSCGKAVEIDYLQYAIQEFEDHRDSRHQLDEIKDLLQQEVCPMGGMGYYYPPYVLVDKDGLIYCVYEYKDEIVTFKHPAEILEDQIGSIALRLERLKRKS